MWGAIKNDLFEFITTVQEDTQQTLSKVVDLDPSFSRTEEDEEKISEEEKKLSEFRNNFATYSEVNITYRRRLCLLGTKNFLI